MTPGQKIELMNMNITAMKNKGYLPKHSLGFFTQDLTNLKKLVAITEAQTFQEWKCPECNFTVWGPKKMMLEHHKTHAMKKERGANEIFQKSYKLYR